MTTFSMSFQLRIKQSLYLIPFHGGRPSSVNIADEALNITFHCDVVPQSKAIKDRLKRD